MATDTESAAPTYQQVVASWNAQADEHNQWAELGEDEKIEWAMACAKSTPPAVVETPKAPAFYTAFGRHDGRPVAMPQYSDTSEASVKRKVFEIAWREGWRGTADERLRELGWQVGPVFTEPPAVVEPPELSPGFTDTARAALLWVLWHHQGGSSPVGQPIRFALGMGQYDRMNEHQLSEAKRWERLHPVNPSVWAQKQDPLTDEQIAVACGWKPGCVPLPKERDIARAIERAHGIT